MKRVALALSFGLLISAVACKKEAKKTEESKPAVATQTTGTTTDGVRTVAIVAGEGGYKPDEVHGKPGEKLKLQFTRKIEGECLSQLKTPDGKLVDLPMNKPIDVEVTVPADGSVKFACGMDMSYLVVVADKS